MKSKSEMQQVTLVVSKWLLRLRPRGYSSDSLLQWFNALQINSKPCLSALFIFLQIYMFKIYWICNEFCMLHPGQPLATPTLINATFIWSNVRPDILSAKRFHLTSWSIKSTCVLKH